MSHESVVTNNSGHNSHHALAKLVTAPKGAPLAVTLTQVDVARLKTHDNYCKLICRSFRHFPITLEYDTVSEADLAMFVVHLDFLEFVSTDPSAVMKACNDPKTAPCMAEILKQSESETIPDFVPVIEEPVRIKDKINEVLRTGRLVKNLVIDHRGRGSFNVDINRSQPTLLIKRLCQLYSGRVERGGQKHLAPKGGEGTYMSGKDIPSDEDLTLTGSWFMVIA
ncbi:hypothetical protein RF11_00905 [Thelohanellus kitauei]|uniref:Uncharacterized protein n=1 Tax=Thelohanellus kitauei TaxID=669202 RepID=A0A0C2IJI9_THEKT|nr:hypothetical protein RF11_00905 [Thelohanellus kitauei]